MRGEFYFPQGYSGVGSDIKWCKRWVGGKRCQLCHHYADFKEWSDKWEWYYLTYWYSEEGWKYSYYRQSSADRFRWKDRFSGRIRDTFSNPKKYNTTGLDEYQIKSLLKKQCRLNSKCKCVKIAQRAHWFCPECMDVVKEIAHYKGAHVHNVMVMDRKDLKAEFLINRLSGII